MTRGLEIYGTAGLSPAAELRELLGREITVTAQFMICGMQPVLTHDFGTDYRE
jgi:hypothetical protein